MRNYPQLTEQNTTRDFIETFGGLNRNIRISDGEFADMKNLTSDYYPTLATRPKRGKTDIVGKEFKCITSLVGMIGKDDLYSVCFMGGGVYETHWIWHTNRIQLLKNGELYAAYGTSLERDVKRQIVSMGAYVVVFPDGVYFNTTDPDDCGTIKKSLKSRYCTFSPVEKDGAEASFVDMFDVTTQPNRLDDFRYGNDEIDEGFYKVIKGPINHLYVYETSSGTAYYWHEGSESWQIAELYLGIYVVGDAREVLSVGDAIRISGFSLSGDGSENDDTSLVKDVFENDIDRPFIITNMTSINIILDYKPRFKKQYYASNNQLSYETVIPKMDYVIESGNRLWGCRYGKNNNGDTVNEIYASKLGDFKNWETFAGVSTDSYTASLGSDGAFTGATSYLGYPTFFKQNCIHTVYGNFPAQYQIQTTECRGVQQGCEKSLVTLDGALFYKAVGGVCAYTGSLPTEIGSQLNEKGIQFTEAIAGTYQHKYYLAMKDLEKGDGKHWLYVYDTNKGLWHKESPITGLMQFCDVSVAGKSELYYGISYGQVEEFKLGDVDNSVLEVHQIIGNKDTTNEDKVGWYAETGIMGCSSPDKKYISRLSLRLSMGVGTRVYVSAEYDSSGVWEQIAVIVGSKLGTFTIPIRPKRCDHLRLRLEGDDEVKIYSISKTMEQGSDI